MSIPEENREAFLHNYRLTGNVSKSCAAAKINRATIYLWLSNDEAFKKEFDQARKDSIIVLEDEANRRAVKGTLKPVFYKGERCGSVREYSDTLLIVLLKANDPERYKERSQHDLTGEISHRVKTVEVVRSGN